MRFWLNVIWLVLVAFGYFWATFLPELLPVFSSSLFLRESHVSELQHTYCGLLASELSPFLVRARDPR